MQGTQINKEERLSLGHRDRNMNDWERIRELTALAEHQGSLEATGTLSDWESLGSFPEKLPLTMSLQGEWGSQCAKMGVWFGLEGSQVQSFLPLTGGSKEGGSLTAPGQYTLSTHPVLATGFF